MKLNLLPATVSKGAQARTAWIGAVFLILLGVGASAYMIVSSTSSLTEAKKALAEAKPKAEEALATSQQADTIIAKSDNVLRNTSLAREMLKHNDVYPKLYDDVLSYVPGFYRLTSLVATPLGAGSAQVTMTGTLETYQQYSDLMLALLKFPGTSSVARAGYVSTDKIVPAINAGDRIAEPRLPGGSPVPTDPLAKLAYFEAQGSTEQYSGVSNFGSGNPDTRFALPNSSLVTVVMVISRDLQPPDVRGTLAGASGGAGTATSVTPGAGAVPASVPVGAKSAGKLGSDD